MCIFIELDSKTIVIVIAVLPKEIIVLFVDPVKALVLVTVVFELIKIILEKTQL